MQNKLKPCPFCGGKAEYIKYSCMGIEQAIIRCTNCHVRYTQKFIPKKSDWIDEVMINDWNRRITDADTN